MGLLVTFGSQCPECRVHGLDVRLSKARLEVRTSLDCWLWVFIMPVAASLCRIESPPPSISINAVETVEGRGTEANSHTFPYHRRGRPEKEVRRTVVVNIASGEHSHRLTTQSAPADE